MDKATDAGELGEFLRTRRAGLTPEHVGITSYGARRVPGLRREELAQLAGVSATYYTRLEQGQSTNASEAVIEAIARALSLDDDERAHLHELGRPMRAPRRRPARTDHARPGTVRLLGAMADVPAVVLGRRNEVLAWNSLGHLLLAGHLAADAPTRPTDRPNLTRMLFLDPHTRDLHRNWPAEAALAVASMRFVAAQFRGDRELAELIGELTLNSPTSPGCGPNTRSRSARAAPNSSATPKSVTSTSTSRCCIYRTSAGNASSPTPPNRAQRQQLPSPCCKAPARDDSARTPPGSLANRAA